VRFLTNADVDALVDPAAALTAVHGAFEELARGSAAVQARERTAVGDVKLSTLGAVIAGDGVLGAKAYSTVAGNFSFLVVLFAADDGRRLAALESDALTRLRTAATSTLAARLLARPSPKRLVVFGSGSLAQGHVHALADAFEPESVTMVGRTPPVEVAAELSSSLRVPVSTGEARASLEGADLVVTATRATDPLFPSSWLPDGAHVSAVGSSRPEARELDDDTYRRARTVAVEWRPQAAREAGGLLHAVEAGAVTWERVVELADLLAERVPGRVSPDDVTLFQSVGIGLEDVALAAEVWRRAEAADVGVVLGSRAGQ
jgi:ornithine cyclodeaminase